MDGGNELSKTTLFIRGLADEVDREILYSAFSPFGTILNLDIPKDKEKGTNRGIAFIEHQSELYGRVIKVAFSTHAHLRQSGSHRFKAVWADDPNFGHNVPQDVEL
ncbi:hypothetical protein BEWA_031050 [Theileria equi strain WA]|uniref:RRM domain-containing protein n=1 Tax=Theileria equi strain WA TaxID=1537102 RepID=L0AXE7_THEEQ|nr:hypothetical protein BEWA_031050 [Theileria equi strain WA]AFZ80252.1 hypothetical protein BEWA_031050 [Theileria equi strain WA]|eukprot:XP_004829918.1 hypothetical protein BEWA_031050 [Theileria equi strain WA]